MSHTHTHTHTHTLTVLQVISTHRGSLSPDDMDSLLQVQKSTPTSNKPSGSVVGQHYNHTPVPNDSRLNDIKSLPGSPSLLVRSLGGTGKTSTSGTATRRLSQPTRNQTSTSSVVNGPLSQPAGDKTTVEDVEMNDSFQLQTTLIPGGSHGNGSAAGEMTGRGGSYESVDLSQSSPASPVHHVGFSVSQAPPPRPGALHMAAK